MRFSRVACATVLLMLQTAAADPLAPKTVHFSTCTAAGVEHGCLVARGDDGALYNVTGALPGLKANQWLQGTAFVTNRASYCMQGATISDFKPDGAQKPGTCRGGDREGRLAIPSKH